MRQRPAPDDDAAQEDQPNGFPAQRRPPRARLKALLRLAVSAALIFLLLWKVNPREVLDSLMRIHPAYVPLAWAYYAGCLAISAYRWRLLLNAKQIRVPLRKLLSFYFVGMFLNNFMPSAVGGDVAKAYCLYRYTGRGKYAVITVFLDRFTGLIGLSVLSVLVLGFAFNELSSPMVLGAVGGTAVFLLAVVLSLWHRPLVEAVLGVFRKVLGPSVGEGLAQLYDALAGYKDHRKTLAGAVAISVVLHVLFAGYYAMTAAALGIDVEAVHFVIFLPLVTLVTMIPISLGGLGVREALMIVLFRAVGVDAADVLSICLTAYIINMLLSLWGGFILLWQKPLAAAEPANPGE